MHDEEQAFLEAIRLSPNDNTLRMVYADWLDERGKPGGSYLRIECEMQTMERDYERRDELRVRLQESAKSLNSDWLAWVGRAKVENCITPMLFVCPKQWHELEMTSDADIRHCDECHKNVYFCSDIHIARSLASNDACVALASQVARKEGDLDQDQIEAEFKIDPEECITTIGILDYRE